MEKFWEWIYDEDKLVAPPALLLGMAGIAGFIVAADNLVKDLITTGVKRRLALYLLLEILWVGFWIYKKQALPKVKKNRLGIIIALTTENNKDKIRLKTDFMKLLKQLVSQHGLDKVIEVVQLKNYQAERVVSVLSKYQVQLSKLRDENIPIDRDLVKQRLRLQKRINGVLYVFGAVVERDIGTYFLETDIIVHHGPIQMEAQKNLQTAVLSIWSPRFSFQEKAEYLGFRFSATYIYLAARYIIGEAAFAVGRFDIALMLHETLESELGTLAGHPNLKAIKDRLKQLIVEEHTIIAFLAYNNEGDLNKAAFHNAQSFKYHPNNYDSLLLRSVLEVVRERNLAKALQTAYQARNVAGRNGTWRYSVGFLLLNMGKTQKALEIYKQIETHTYEGEDITLDQVFEFNHDIIKEDAHNVESLFIIAFLEYKKRDNYPQAHVYLSSVIEFGSDDSKYDLLVKCAQKYLSEVEYLMAHHRD